MLEQNIKCANFCPYNKKLFCPFYIDDENTPESPSETPEDVNKPDFINIKTKKSSIKPFTFKRKKKNKGDEVENDPGEPEWMIFDGIISIYDFFTLNISGKMIDLKLGEFQASLLEEDNKEENFKGINGNGMFVINNKDCDFGGDIELNLQILNLDDSIKNYKLSGTFETHYKSGGIPIEEDPPIEEDEMLPKDEEKQISRKYYTGTIKLGNLNGTISFYTSM